MNVCTISLSNGLTFTRTFIRDPYRKNQINAISNSFDGVSVHSTAYSHDLLSRRTNIVMTAPSGTNTLSCSYNARSEVTGVTIDTNEYAYTYDEIGNSLFTSLNAATNAYSVNNLNQYSSLQPKDLQPINLSYDLDGNMLTNGDWSFTYDAENRMIDAYSNDTLLASNTYDHQSRRIRKAVSSFDHSFIWDGWNLIHERVAHTNGTVDEIEYVWGLDLSGSLQGAGGVGGLLFEKRNGNIFIPCYDANGNITSYVDTNGTIRAYRVYDAFGKTIAKGGDMVDVFHFWFSTKLLDHDTGLYYYGYRYYSPMLQRWINRDPIEENGGVNLYGFTGNNSLCNTDRLGDSYGNPPSQEVTCGPDVTAAVLATLADIRNEYSKLSVKQRCLACTTLYTDRELGWDIIPLYNLGYKVTRDFSVVGKARDGEYTVQFKGQCYHASAVNYAMWGTANQLCRKTFPIPYLDVWKLDFALAAMTYKKLRYDFFAQAIEAQAFTIYGYSGFLPPVLPFPWVGRPYGLKLGPGLVGTSQPYEWRWRPFHSGSL